MSKVFIPRLLFASLMLSLVVGCTNTRQDISTYRLVATLWEAVKSRGQTPVAPDRQLVDTQIEQALASTDEPLALISFDKNQTVALLRQIETNGPYRTWASYGSSERRSVTTRAGVVTATRGLGFDLMSSSVNGLLDMVTERRDGIERQLLRHLDGENIIEETEAYCAFTPDGTEPYSRGTLRQTTTRIDVFCKIDDGRFLNHYLVNEAGRIVEARQWLGPDLGFATFQALR